MGPLPVPPSNRINGLADMHLDIRYKIFLMIQRIGASFRLEVNFMPWEHDARRLLSASLYSSTLPNCSSPL